MVERRSAISPQARNNLRTALHTCAPLRNSPRTMLSLYPSALGDMREMVESLANRLRSSALLELTPRATSARRSSVRAWDLRRAGSSPLLACCRHVRAVVHEDNDNFFGSSS